MLSAVDPLEKDKDMQLLITARHESQGASLLAYRETHISRIYVEEKAEYQARNQLVIQGGELQRRLNSPLQEVLCQGQRPVWEGARLWGLGWQHGSMPLEILNSQIL